jgi:plant 3beta-hydroxysteroid-4alpha-carboxylate 3-dehydrogenase
MTIIEALIGRGERKVVGLDVAAPKRPIAGASYQRGDVCDYAGLVAALKYAKAEVVFLTVAIIRYYERLPWQYAASHDINVTGTENVVRACVECGVAVLVQTSTSNVCVSEGLVSMEMDESSRLIDASNSPNHYGWTKVQAERIVLQAHETRLPGGHGALQTAAVRPCSAIFGPQDNFITQKWLDAGAAQLILPEPKIDYVYVENVCYAHLLTERALLAERGQSGGEVGGQAFCISNGEPLIANEYYSAVQYFYQQATSRPFAVVYLPRNLMVLLAHVVEVIQRVTKRQLSGEIALLTPAMFAVARCSYGFSYDKARQLLGYSPLYTVDEAVQRTVHLWHMQKEEKNDKPSKTP